MSNSGNFSDSWRLIYDRAAQADRQFYYFPSVGHRENPKKRRLTFYMFFFREAKVSLAFLPLGLLVEPLIFLFEVGT
ncbi:MAG: hypothetical protein AAF600_20260 [Bacteroidota bacterium]